MVTGNPTWKIPICGAARFRMPSARLAINNAVTTGNDSNKPVEKTLTP